MFKIAVTAYTGEKYIGKCLNSIKIQTLDFRCVIIDDASTDKTFEIAKKTVGDDSRFKILRNKKKQGKMASFFQAIDALKPNKEDIIVEVDGDDWLKHDKVLERVKEEYDKGALATYGQFENPNGHKGFCGEYPEEIITRRDYRRYSWLASHLKTYKYFLLEYIRKQGFTKEEYDRAFPLDMQIMFPILEMAGKRVHFIPDVLYVYNNTNPLNFSKLDRAKQIKCEKIVRNQEKYPTLEEIEAKETKVSIVIPVRFTEKYFSNITPLKLCLKSLRQQTISPELVEIIISNYGSEQSFTNDLEKLCEMYNVKLIHTYEISVWNRARALNLGIRSTNPKSPYIIACDVDFILHKDWLKKVLSLAGEKKVILTQVWNLPEMNIPDNYDIRENFDELLKISTLRPKSGMGFACFPRKWIFKIRGYDEQYKVWGSEDNDLVKRAELSGMEIVWLEKDDLPLKLALHQWHPVRGESNEKWFRLNRKRLVKLTVEQKILKRNDENWGLAKEKYIPDINLLKNKLTCLI
ncbi:hypothetical protein DRP43_02210, partial [candidate division TA06 bacterium]